MTIKNWMNLLYFPLAAWKALRMDRDERARRMMAAFISRDVYDSGTRLAQMAQQIGGEFGEEALAYIRENKILVVEQVWELTEANRLRDELAQRVAEAQQRLEGGNDV